VAFSDRSRGRADVVVDGAADVVVRGLVSVRAREAVAVAEASSPAERIGPEGLDVDVDELSG
jgi:hypothetical protein